MGGPGGAWILCQGIKEGSGVGRAVRSVGSVGRSAGRPAGRSVGRSAVRPIERPADVVECFWCLAFPTRYW